MLASGLPESRRSFGAPFNPQQTISARVSERVTVTVTATAAAAAERRVRAARVSLGRDWGTVSDGDEAHADGHRSVVDRVA